MNILRNNLKVYYLPQAYLTTGYLIIFFTISLIIDALTEEPIRLIYTGYFTSAILPSKVMLEPSLLLKIAALGVITEIDFLKPPT